MFNSVYYCPFTEGFSLWLTVSPGLYFFYFKGCPFLKDTSLQNVKASIYMPLYMTLFQHIGYGVLQMTSVFSSALLLSRSIASDSLRPHGRPHGLHGGMPDPPVLHTSRSLLKLMSIALVMPSNHLILCCLLLLLPSIFPSIRVFSNESALCIRLPKYWSFSFSHSPSNELFRTDFL